MDITPTNILRLQTLFTKLSLKKRASNIRMCRSMTQRIMSGTLYMQKFYWLYKELIIDIDNVIDDGELGIQGEGYDKKDCV